MSSLKYDLWLSEATQKRPKAANDLLARFGSSEKVFFSSKEELDALDFLTPPEREALSHKNLARSREILRTCEEKGIKLLTIADGGYPFRLKNIVDAPVVLYYRGKLMDLDEEAAVAVIGTRGCSGTGRRAARRLGKELTEGGGLVVTGLARGIDSEAAWGALEAGGPLVGVLGCGLDVVYPPENGALYDKVAEDGLLISEYPPGTKPDAFRFPMRNRIMSGLAVAAAVVEAPERSGALITANLALEQGRDVFVLPGGADNPAARGSNRLLLEGATPFLKGEDILSNYEAQFPQMLGRAEDARQSSAAPEPAPVLPVTDPTEQAVLELLRTDPRRLDELIELSGLEAAQIMTAVTMLQLGGHVAEEGERYTFLQ